VWALPNGASDEVKRAGERIAQAGQAAQQGTQEGEDFQEEGQEGPRGQQGNSDHVSPYILYGPHGYNTFTHSRCQEVPTVDVQLSAIKGDWYLLVSATTVQKYPN